MKQNVLLITPDDIRQETTVSDNMEDALIAPSIRDAQLSGLMPLTGERLFDALCSKVEDGTIDDEGNEAYKDLIDKYIHIYLLYKVQASLTFEMFARTHNAGVVQYSDPSYMQVPIAENKYSVAHYENKADYYAGRLTDYLHAHHADYPEFTSRSCGEMPHDDNARYNCGIALGRKVQWKDKTR